MTRKADRILYRVAEKVFEQMAFMFPFGEEGDAFENDKLAAGVAFSGPLVGTLAVRLSLDLLPELAANMLGVEPSETTPDQHRDAFKELLNVICGNLLPELGGKQAIFKVETPEIHDTAVSPPEAVCVARTRLFFDEGGCELSLFMDHPLSDDLAEAPKPTEDVF